jgi:predicted DNA-binding transcriptional regulator AlpA
MKARLPRKLLTAKALIERGVFANVMGLWRARKYHGFPKPFTPGERSLKWDEDEVAAWLATRRNLPPPKPGRKAVAGRNG